MEDEIKVGEYIRTCNGEIGKLVKIEFDEIDKSLKWYFYNDKRHYKRCVNKPYIVKHSKKIFDLLEKGDYVNGDRILALKGDIPESDVANKKDIVYTDYVDEYGEYYGLEKKDIENIITKEQMENVQYKIK